jgi:putative ABC transport system permease protein
MDFWMIFKVSILAIARNKTRSILTCIGIIVGIAAVIAVLAIGKGASKMMIAQISSMGNNLVMVFPERRSGPVHGGMGQGQTLTADDAMAIKRELSHLVQGVSPTVNATVQMIYQDKNWSGRVSGVSTDMPMIRN